MIFRKRTARGKTLLQKALRARRAMPLCRHQVNRRQETSRRIVGPTPSGPGPPFRKLLNGCGVAYEPATGSLTRTRPEEAYLGVLCGGTGGRLSCKKEPPGLPAERKK